MNHYIIFALGIVVGVPFGMFMFALCQMAREDYYYPEEKVNPPTKK